VLSPDQKFFDHILLRLVHKGSAAHLSLSTA